MCLAILLVLPIKANASFLQVSEQSKTVEQSGQQSGPPAADQSAGTPQPGSPQQPAKFQQDSQEPRGTAAAPEIRPDGVPASTVSGVAIAPIRQKRVRRFSVATALAIGAAVAVGIVVGLSAASPARQ